MPVARKYTVSLEKPSVYHCQVRCVRQAFLCGYDRASQKDYSHRRGWVEQRIQFLSQVFAADILGFSVLDNHFHLVIHMDPDRAAQWSEREVARRWLTLHPKDFGADGQPLDPSEKSIERLCADPERMAILRARLKDLSWFMASLNEYIVRRANREDQCKGRFWEGRFSCQRADNKAAILACMIYVDLNQVRARMVDRPEVSRFCSLALRFKAEIAREKLRRAQELFRENPSPALAAQIDQLRAQAHADAWLQELDPADDHLVGISARDYLALVDWAGRSLPKGKRGAIPSHLPPILERMDINVDQFVSCIRDFDKIFGRIIGNQHDLRIAAKQNNLKWVRGKQGATRLFKKHRPHQAA